MHHHEIPVPGDLVLLFLASLLGSSHCVGMCGPYVALCAARIGPVQAAERPPVVLQILFNGGRLVVYAAIGAFAGGFGQIAIAAVDRAGLKGTIALLTGALAMFFGLALLGWVKDPAQILTRLGFDGLIRGGARGAFQAPPYAAAFLLGSLQGAFPCALVYGAAARAAAAGSPSGGAATMLVFGLGTVPAIFALSSLSPKLLARLQVWRWSGAFIALVGVLLVLRGLSGLGVLPAGPLW